MNSPGMKAHHRPSGQQAGGPRPLSISIPNSMSYRNAPAPKLSPTDDDLSTPKKPQFYRPPGSPESPEVPQAFFNYNHDRIQNDLLDEICDEIGIKDATDLDFMDFEPPSLNDSFNPGDVGSEIDNLDQLIMFGQLDPQQNPGVPCGVPPHVEADGMPKWGGELDPECTSMPHNSPVYGNSPVRPGLDHGPDDYSAGFTRGYPGQAHSPVPGQYNDVPQSPREQKPYVNPPGALEDPSHFGFDESHSSRAHMTDDYKIASPRKNSADHGHGPASHDSMLKMAIAQDRMYGARAASPSLDNVGSPASPATTKVPSPSTPSTPSKTMPSNNNQPKVNQTDTSKGLDQFAAPENPGKERAMSRMKLVDGKRSPFDQGYFSVGSGGSHYEDGDVAGVTPPHCPDPIQEESTTTEGVEVKVEKPLTDDALLTMSQCKAEGGALQPPQSPSIARREIHRAVLPRPSAANKPSIFHRQTSGQNPQSISFQPPGGTYQNQAMPQSHPGYTAAAPNQAIPSEAAQTAHPSMAASANCAPYPRSCRAEDMTYGAKRSGSNPSSPKKQRRLTYNPYQGENSVSVAGQYDSQTNMAGRPASGNGQQYAQPQNSMSSQNNMGGRPASGNGQQYAQPQSSMNSCQMGGSTNGDGSVQQQLTNQYNPIGQSQQRAGYTAQPGVVPGAHGANPRTINMSSQMGYNNQGQYNHCSNQQQAASHQQYHNQHGSQMNQQGHMIQNNTGYQQQQQQSNNYYKPNNYQQMQNRQSNSAGYGQQQQQLPQQQAAGYVQSGGQPPPTVPQPAMSTCSDSSGQQSLSSLLANHPEAGKYGFMQHIISDRSSAFRSHPLFPLLRDLIVADMNFASPTFPFQLIANLPADFDKLLSNYFQRNPPTQKYEANQAVENVVVDALRYAHKALIEKITERKQKLGIAEQPKMFSAIEDFCERFDQAVKHTMTRNETQPKPNMPNPPPSQQQQQPIPSQPQHPHRQQQHVSQHHPQQQQLIQQQQQRQMPHPAMVGQQKQAPVMGSMNPPSSYPQQQQPLAPPPQPSNGPHGTMGPSGAISMHQPQPQGGMRSMSPFDQNVAGSFSRQTSFPPQPSTGGWGPGRTLGPPGGMSASLPSTPTKYGGAHGRHYPHHPQQAHSNHSSTTTLSLSDCDLTQGPLSDHTHKMGYNNTSSISDQTHKLGYTNTSSMPNFINSSGVGNRLAASTPPLGLPAGSPYKAQRGGVSPGPDMLHRAGSEPALNNMKYGSSPQREYGKDQRNNNNNNNNTTGQANNNTGTRKQVLPKEAVAIMLDWLREHRDNPYPNDDEKYMLIQQTKLTMAQINYWFTNARRRILPKWTLQRLMEEQARATGRELTPEQQKEILSTKLTPQAVRNILEGGSLKKSVSDINYGHIMNTVINQSS